ncbi:MAG: nuclear transport factor 2 family protein [Chthoniobacterales bacterium]
MSRAAASVDEPASGNVGDTIKRLEQEWESAISSHETSVIERVVADDFVGVSSTGRIGDKGTLIYEAKRDKNSYKTARAQQMRVHTFGPRVAVVLGLTRESGTTSAGRPFDHSYRFTDTWMERGGKWQCVAAHASVATKR